MRQTTLRIAGRFLHKIGIQIIKPGTMVISPNDLFVVLEINNEGASTTEPMTQDNIVAHVALKYGEQPLKYFNEYKRLKIVHLKTGTVKDLKLAIDF